MDARYIKFSDLTRGEQKTYQKVGKVTSESVRKHTGRGWKQWIGTLEKAGAGGWTYQEIVAYLRTKHRLSPWWQQGVALGFEIATGRRKAGQDAKGRYMVTATKSLPCDVKAVWKALISVEGQRIWLQPLVTEGVAIQPKTQFETCDGFFGEVRTVAPFRRARLYWQDPAWGTHTVLEVHLVQRPGKKSILVFNHSGIKESRTQALLRARWRTAADRIADLLANRA